MAIQNATSHPHDSEADVNKILEQFDAYILYAAQMHLPRKILSPETLTLDFDELTQIIRIKLWLTLKREPITNLKAYIWRIAYTEAVNMVRRHKPTLSLSTDESAESFLANNTLVSSAEGMRDPSYEFEQKEVEREGITKTVHAVLVLPPRQQQAMFCSLKERLDNLLPLIDIMHNQQIDLEEITWPQEKADVQRFRSLVSITRKKLHGLLDDL